MVVGGVLARLSKDLVKLNFILASLGSFVGLSSMRVASVQYFNDTLPNAMQIFRLSDHCHLLHYKFKNLRQWESSGAKGGANGISHTLGPIFCCPSD